MNCLRYWARYVRKVEVKGGGKNREVLRKEGCSFWWSFGLVTKFSQPKA